MIQHPSWRDASVYETQPVETLFNDENLGSWTLLREFSRPDDSYNAESRLGAAYAMIETPSSRGFVSQAALASRAFRSNFSQKVPSAEQDDDAQGTNRVDYDILPSAALVLPVTDEHILRAAYSMTVARPQTRELAPYAYYDFVRERNISGNPDLRRTQVHNADLRWEWYLGGTDLFAASVFYKQFYDPIELVIRDPSSFDAAYGNADSATVVGGEMEMRLGLGRIHDSLADFTLGANIALVHSEVEISDEEAGAVNAERPLLDSHLTSQTCHSVITLKTSV